MSGWSSGIFDILKNEKFSGQIRKNVQKRSQYHTQNVVTVTPTVLNVQTTIIANFSTINKIHDMFTFTIVLNPYHIYEDLVVITSYHYDMICNNADKISLCKYLVSADSGM